MTSPARYRSLFVIGRGGMGTVEAALELGDAKGTEARRVVALKRLLPDAARDSRRAEMFLREARVAQLLDHPNVVRAFDYGEVDGELYLAMEYIEGQPLSRMLRALADAGETMPVPVVAWMLAEVCRGLHAAHELRDASGEPLKLVHRDVSPQNVMIGYDGTIRLLDFGVAKIETESVTKTGEVKGKTAYMSPEQAMGEPVDRRSDLFGLGALLFECLTLKRMWGSGTDMEVIRKLALEDPPALEGAVPEGLSALYRKLVARAPGDRPIDARVVADELGRFVGDAPQDREGAVRTLRELAERHFGEQAREQRARLTSSLHETVPEQADSLRASVLPASARAAKAPSAADRPPPRAKSTRRMTFAAAGIVVVALVSWRAMTSATARVAPAAIASSQANAPGVSTSDVPNEHAARAPGVSASSGAGSAPANAGSASSKPGSAAASTVNAATTAGNATATAGNAAGSTGSVPLGAAPRVSASTSAVPRPIGASHTLARPVVATPSGATTPAPKPSDVDEKPF